MTHARGLGVHVGSSYYFVSEATYLVDPDGLTVEVYRDRPRSEWIVNEHGEIVTGILPLDVEAVQRDERQYAVGRAARRDDDRPRALLCG